MTAHRIYQARITARESRYTIRGIDTLVREWGPRELPPVVYLHGWADTGATFQFVVDALAGERRIVAPDLRGFGDSHGEAHAYWFPDYLADLDALLNLVSPDAPAALIGHSMGGNVAGLYAGALPERVGAFVNIEGFGLPDTRPDEAPARYRRWLLDGREQARFKSYPDFHALARRIARRNPGITAARAEFVARCWAVRDGTKVVLRADPLHKLPNPILYRRAEGEACWRNVTAPVLLVAGANSDIARLGSGPGRGPGSLPFSDATAVRIPDAGHMLHFEAPEALALAIDAFFAKAL